MNKTGGRAAALLLLLAILLTLPGIPAGAEETRDVRSITISAVGDCTLGRVHSMDYYNSWDYVYDRKGSGWFFQNVADIFAGDDLTIANLEGVLSDSARRRYTFYRQNQDRVAKKKYCHLGRPVYARVLRDGGVDVLSFANNHNIDYGLQGFVDTLDACAGCGLPVSCYDRLVRCEVQGVTVGVLAVDTVYCSRAIAKEYLRAGVADLKRDCDLIVACVHWGNNYKKQVEAEQIEFGHLCVELGADLVLGCHTHVLQGVERYRGRYIFYSLGNFSYGGKMIPEDMDTVIAQQTFTFTDGELQLDDAVRLIPCRMSTRKDINNYSPVVLTDKDARRVIRKINVRSRSFGLRFNDEGRPEAAPAEDTALPPAETAPGPLRAEEIPVIIRVLLGMEDEEAERLKRDHEISFVYDAERKESEKQP